MKHQIFVKPEVDLQPTDEEFDFLLKCCKLHYSYDCQSLIEVGGFLYGWKGRREFYKNNKADKGDERPSYTISFRQMDTLLKAMEMAPYWAKDAEADIWMRLNKFFHDTLRQMNEIGATVNEKISKGEL